MTFKLENIKLEGINKEQKIIGEYSFGKKSELSGDRTFCLVELLCGCNDNCECEDVSTTQGEYPSRYCRHSCSPHESNQLY